MTERAVVDLHFQRIRGRWAREGHVRQLKNECYDEAEQRVEWR